MIFNRSGRFDHCLRGTSCRLPCSLGVPRTDTTGYENPSPRDPIDTVLKALNRSEITVCNYLETDRTCTVEVHAGDAETDDSNDEFPRVFVVELRADGISRWRTYLPLQPR